MWNWGQKWKNLKKWTIEDEGNQNSVYDMPDAFKLSLSKEYHNEAVKISMVTFSRAI